MRLPSLPGFSIPYPILTVRRASSSYPLRRRNYRPLLSVFHAVGMVLLGTLAVLCMLAAAVWEFLQGFFQGFRDARTTPAPEPPRQPSTGRAYEVHCNEDSEVTLNGLPIGYIASGPWQFCSYTEPPAPPRDTKARSFDDACDYAESVVRSA